MEYRPIVSLSERRVFGHEALLRSAEPALSEPGAILDAAERLGGVHALGGVVRDRVAAIVAKAKDGGAGIETTGERDALQTLGWDLLQGYLFAKPGEPFPQVTW
jgi:EAL domain-containing protein (putative c-di-GMP-specific phosphodiesterase class I)